MSLRNRLVVLLLVAVAAVGVTAATLAYFDARHEIDRRTFVHGTMADRARALGIVDASLSLSEERGLATAILVAVIAPAPRLR